MRAGPAPDVGGAGGRREALGAGALPGGLETPQIRDHTVPPLGGAALMRS